MDHLQLQVIIDPDLPPVIEGAVSFETGSTNLGLHVYGPGRVGPLLAFFEDLILGAPMPLAFAMHRVSGPHSVIAATLFLRRDLAIHPSAPALVYAADLAYRGGGAMLSHVDSDLARFLLGLGSYFTPSLSKKEQGERLSSAMQWVGEYLTQGVLPNLGPRPEPVEVLEVGTNGFVLAYGNPSARAWETLYRNGHLRGMILGPPDGDFRHVLIARKSQAVGFDLDRACVILNELETLSGGAPGWVVGGNYLSSPPEGTTILMTYVTEVLLRV